MQLSQKPTVCLSPVSSEKVDFPGTPPSYRAASQLQVPTAASIGPLHVLHPRPVTVGLKGADGRQVKEREKTAVGLSNDAGEGLRGEGGGEGRSVREEGGEECEGGGRGGVGGWEGRRGV